eukprot:6172853-Pleurochrysis_carterae.AAC.3
MRERGRERVCSACVSTSRYRNCSLGDEDEAEAMKMRLTLEKLETDTRHRRKKGRGTLRDGESSSIC